MTPQEAKYQAENNVETENVKYAVANKLMSAEDSGLTDDKLTEKPLTVSEAIAVADAKRDYSQPVGQPAEKITTKDNK